jgi:cation transport protein ChaC
MPDTYMPDAAVTPAVLNGTPAVLNGIPALGSGVSDMPACWRTMLDPAREAWIFAYGSLMWDPGFPHAEVHPAVLRGYHRRFCLFSHRYRGTPERPGLVLGLDRGGTCRGLAYKVVPPDVPAALDYLWDREMTGGAYEARTVPVLLGDAGAGTPGRVLAFVVRRQHEHYCGRLDLEETARLILQGVGGRGRCRDYLDNTVRQLERLGMMDRPLRRLEHAVKALAAKAPPCPEVI